MNISVIPRATEKAYAESLATNTYVFNVPLTANKQEIIAAVEAQFEVKVTGIKTLVQSGKAVRFSRGNLRRSCLNRKWSALCCWRLIGGGRSTHFMKPRSANW